MNRYCADLFNSEAALPSTIISYAFGASGRPRGSVWTVVDVARIWGGETGTALVFNGKALLSRLLDAAARSIPVQDFTGAARVSTNCFGQLSRRTSRPDASLAFDQARADVGRSTSGMRSALLGDARPSTLLSRRNSSRRVQIDDRPKGDRVGSLMTSEDPQQHSADRVHTLKLQNVPEEGSLGCRLGWPRENHHRSLPAPDRSAARLCGSPRSQ